MDFGMMFANTMGTADPAAAVELARASEDAGFESIFGHDLRTGPIKTIPTESADIDW